MDWNKKYTIQKNYLLLLLVAVVSFVGVVSHAAIASYSVERRVANVIKNMTGNEEFFSTKFSGGKKIIIPYNLSTIEMPRDGSYNSSSANNDGFIVVVANSSRIAFGQYPQTFGWYMPFPFLIPFAIHLGVVWGLPIGMKVGRIRNVLYKSCRLFEKRALVAAVYAYLITVFFQSSRMIWGSEAWGLKYFVSYEYGWTAFYLFFGLCVAMYLYCVIGTAGLHVRRKPSAKKQACIRCGYRTEGLERCPECDLEVGAFIPSKWRVNHWYLAAMFLVTFFSPVLVESAYSILW